MFLLHDTRASYVFPSKIHVITPPRAAAISSTKLTRPILQRLDKKYSFKQVCDEAETKFCHSQQLSAGTILGTLKTATKRLNEVKKETSEG